MPLVHLSSFQQVLATQHGIRLLCCVGLVQAHLLLCSQNAVATQWELQILARLLAYPNFVGLHTMLTP